jgi:hypothetical protein
MVKTWRLGAKCTWLALWPQEQPADLSALKTRKHWVVLACRPHPFFARFFEIHKADRASTIRRVDGGPQSRHH